jgi:hypothetical protein
MSSLQIGEACLGSEGIIRRLRCILSALVRSGHAASFENDASIPSRDEENMSAQIFHGNSKRLFPSTALINSLAAL